MAEPTMMQRKALAAKGLAMPDGSYYIRNKKELGDAIEAIGRGGADHDVIRKFCIKRAADLGASDMIPADWNPDGSLKHQMTPEESVSDFLEHFGVKGMKWGVRRDGSSGGSRPAHPVAEDHTKVAELRTRAKTNGTKALSNTELKLLVDRLGLEDRYGKLTPEVLSGGDKAKALVKKEAANFARQQANQYVNQYGAKGAQHIAKLIITSTGPHLGKHVLG